jgi:hypothetical protein
VTVTARVLFDTPQREVASLLADLYDQSWKASLVAGFITVEGIGSIEASLARDPAKLDLLLVGAGTWRAFDAFDRLAGLGARSSSLRVHLGHTRTTSAGARHPFYRYHPMLHSKVYLFELGGGRAAAFIGSHNLTGFALLGLNGEAAVLLEGPTDAEQFDHIRQHIAAAAAGAVEYDPAMREGYAWWAWQFMEGLADKFNDTAREGEAARTFVVLAECSDRSLPKKGDILYFEIPAALGKIRAVNSEVHVYLFDPLPASPQDALANLASARKSLWCATVGLEDDQGGRELEADWQIQGNARPVLSRTVKPFRPASRPGMQQVRVSVRNEVYGEFKYLFETGRATFEPILDESSAVALTADAGRSVLEELDLIPPEHLPWFAVTGLRRTDPEEDEVYRAALRQVSPESGAFILLSLRRQSGRQRKRPRRRT